MDPFVRAGRIRDRNLGESLQQTLLEMNGQDKRVYRMDDAFSSGIGSLDDTDDGEMDNDDEGESDSSVASSVINNYDTKQNNTLISSQCKSESKSKTKIRDRHHSFGAISSLSKSGCKDSGDAKKVRFADALGLDLVKVQLFDIADEFKSANKKSEQHIKPTTNTVTKTLVPMFKQPSALPDFLDLVRWNKVCLENAYLDSDKLSVRGIVRVLNMDYHKAVYIRWTINEWRNMVDYRASYVMGSNDELSDKFQFKIYAPLNAGQSLIFAVRYHCVGQQFWDNNRGKNYRFLCKSIVKKDDKEQKSDNDDPGINMGLFY